MAGLPWAVPPFFRPKRAVKTCCGAAEPALEYASLVGRSASLSLPQLTPVYVGHLLALGLVEIGPEEDDLGPDYEVLLADPTVLRAVKASTRGPLPARIERGSLRLSPLGSELWATAGGTR